MLYLHRPGKIIIFSLTTSGNNWLFICRTKFIPDFFLALYLSLLVVPSLRSMSSRSLSFVFAYRRYCNSPITICSVLL